mmetsp:Transcript_49032/g.118772  ORF Transcript_49032/g.118772 Transcript_49032/m.118772 type:complete len:327 (-) Transcript_49032:1122-2102(-)
MGHDDPRANRYGQEDARITRVIQALSNADPAPKRVKPAPLQVVMATQDHVNGSEHLQALVDAAYVGFFYLLRTGENVVTKGNQPLCLRNVTFKQSLTDTQWRSPHAITRSVTDIKAARFSAITFDTQKNRTKGETIAHGTSGHPWACPTEALKRRVLYLRRHGASPDTPIFSTHTSKGWQPLRSFQLNRILKAAAASLPHLHYAPSDVSGRSLRSGGAMALLLAGVDVNTIKLIGRWRSDAMFRYLHAQAMPLVAPLAGKMFRHGEYSLLPGGLTPTQAQSILASANYPLDCQPTFGPEAEDEVDNTVDDPSMLVDLPVPIPIPAC